MAMEDTVKAMQELICSQVCGQSLLDDAKDRFTPDLCEKVLRLSAMHDLKHLVANAMLKHKLMEDVDGQLQKSVYIAIYRYQRLNFAYEQLCQTMEAAGISFIPLKGTVLRKEYPEPWMRTSCDIDVLVREEMLGQAVNALVTEANFQNQGRGYHDVSLQSPNGMHVELHFSLMEEARFPKANKLIADVWEYARPAQEGSVRYEMSDEMYYFYHILHMANHFNDGGCGVRSFLDLWILDSMVGHDRVARDALLSEAGLLTFANAARQLAGVWFSGEPHSELTRMMEKYILSGGMFGTARNKAAMHQAKKGGKIRSMACQIILPYSMLAGHYPILNRHKWLFPFFQIIRWFRILSPDRWKRSVRAFKANVGTSGKHFTTAEKMLRELELL